LPEIPGYTLVRRLGTGGMGEVHEAINQLGRHFALKVIRPDCAGEQLRARFRKEASALLDVHHPHLARIFEYNEVNGVPYFTMRLLPGGPLSARRRDFLGDARKAAALLATVADAVGYLHRRGLLHRDLKPSNVLFDEEGQPHVSDFGLVKEVGAEEPPGADVAVTTDGGADKLTAVGQVVGTVRYMSPEQLANEVESVGPWSDVWALGVMLYELLTGQRPFEGTELKTLRAEVQQGPPRPPRALNPTLDAALEQIVLTCLARRPQERYPNADALARALCEWLAADQKTLSRRRRRRTWAIVLGLLTVAAAIAVPLLRNLADPERALHAAQRQLQGGEKVELLGAKGMPLYQRPRAGPEAHVWLDRDGVLTVSSQKLALIELLPDPMCDRYRFRVSVRQNTTTTNASRAGLYCLHRACPDALGRHHAFVELSLRENDVDMKAVWEKPLGPGRTVASIALFARLAGDPPVNDNQPGGEDVFETDYHRGQPGPWRDLEVEVTPERVVARHEGKQVGQIKSAVLRRRIDSLLAGRALQGLQRPLTPRDGLGLYVLGSSASFRLGVVEPLPDNLK
jgi:serine/threonine-protein kinase